MGHVKLHIPGPVEVSEKTFRAMSAPMIGHRGQGFKDLYAKIQPQLQQLLYDLEAGMPFLFVEQLVAQAPQGVAGGGGVTGTEGGRLRVLLGVSGQWQEAKPEGKPGAK